MGNCIEIILITNDEATVAKVNEWLRKETENQDTLERVDEHLKWWSGHGVYMVSSKQFVFDEFLEFCNSLEWGEGYGVHFTMMLMKHEDGDYFTTYYL